jgi:hypothetical protein
MKVDGQIVPVAPQADAELQVVASPRETACSGRDDDFIEMWISFDDWSAGRLNDVGNSRVWKPVSQCVDRRCGENDVTDLPEADQKNPRDLITRDVRI